LLQKSNISIIFLEKQRFKHSSKTHFMKNETTETQPKQSWITPAFTVLSVNDETLGLGGGGPDFASELS